MANLYTAPATNPLHINVRLLAVAWGEESRRALVAQTEDPWQTLSWAPRGGGTSLSSSYCCLEVRNSDLPLGLEPQLVLDRFLSALEVDSPVATLTSADIGAYSTGCATERDVSAFVLATTGFANALRVGELVGAPVTRYTPDTINIACWVNRELSLEAQLEALSIVTQARTLAMLEAKIQSSDDTGLATGTGTDCITLFTRPPTLIHGTQPERQPSPQAIYAGMHTTEGRVIGKAVREAMHRATARHRSKHAAQSSPQPDKREP